MRTLVAVRKAGTFTTAARALGISASLVSRHVAQLEREVGVALVDRTPHGVQLTAAGQEYVTLASRVLQEIEDEDAAIRKLRERAEGTLNVASPKWIGNLDLGDAIVDFALEHPRIEVRYEVGRMSEKKYNFLDSGIDIALHTKYLRNSSLQVTKVAEASYVLCASPSYLAGRPALTHPRDLFDHMCLVHSDHQVWTLGRGRSAEHMKVSHPVFASNAYPVLQKAAVRGLGIALLPLQPIQDDIRSGTLVTLLPSYEPPDRALFAVYARSEPMLAKIDTFLTFVTSWLAARSARMTRGPRRDSLARS